MKKIYLGLITSFKDIDKVINSFKFTINELSNHYEQITIINSENLKFFQSRSLSYNNIDFGNDLNKNIKFFNPQNVKEFNTFIKDKEIVLINSLGQTFSEIKVHYLYQYLLNLRLRKPCMCLDFTQYNSYNLLFF